MATALLLSKKRFMRQPSAYRLRGGKNIYGRISGKGMVMPSGAIKNPASFYTADRAYLRVVYNR
ncbi:hypothetical protein [Mixta hanseatica]|uniref:Uncharacterized protein n=1 Tax=Mixta hanseatica TaxID=2872648 RepID=A0ABY4R9B4_9GAMM|nr:hypothetical protein [Mixta hanseatica]UQY44883.1 hypothetical protein K6958_04115 [Mixta hanseatica]